MNYFVHDTAIVEDGASIGDGTKIWHQAQVRSGARVGIDCVLSKNVFVDANVSIGNRVKIQNNVSVYAGVTLEDDVFVGPSAVFTNDLNPRASNPSWTPARTEVRRGAAVGANATIICGVELGEWSMVGAGSVVTHSTARHELVAGNPARRIGWVCQCGNVVVRTTEMIKREECPACNGVIEIQK